ncbi:MAG: copper amine oxidase N-terminal domain-containing protein [Moorellales bacterium]
MRKTRNKAVSMLVALTFLLGLVLAYAGPAAAGTYCTFTGAYKEVQTGTNVAAGEAEVRQAESATAGWEWNLAGVDTVLISVTLPDDVTYNGDPGASGAPVKDYVYVLAGGADKTPTSFTSASRSSVEIKLDATTVGFNQPVNVSFDFSKSGASALDIASDVTGDIKATVEVIGLASGNVKFRESENITIARVVSADPITISAADPKLVTVGKGREAAKITVAETVVNAIYVGTAEAIKLEILSPGVTFNATAGTASGIRLNAANPVRQTTDDTVALVTVSGRTVTGMPGKVEITPNLDVSPAASGDVKIKVTAYKPDRSTVSGTVTVAKVSEKVTFAVSDVKNTGGKVYAGYKAAVVKEAGKAAELTIKTLGGNFPNGTYIYVDIVGAKFEAPAFAASAGVSDVTIYNDGKSAWFTAPSTSDKVRLYDFKVSAASDAAEGDIVLKLSSNLGSFDTEEVVIGKVAKPISVQASGAPEITYLGRGQAAGSITIKEAKDGAILADGLKLSLPDGVKFSALPTVKVTSGKLTVTKSLADDNSALVLQVSSASSEAATIEITDIKYDATRLALDGDVEVTVAGYDDGKAPAADWADTKPLAKAVNAKVVSEAAARTAVFTIGSTTYTVNGTECTMDVAPYIKDNRTYLPVRYVAYALGVSEDNIFYANGQVSILNGGRAVQLTIGSKTMVVNGVAITMDVAPEIQAGRTMLPFRWVATALGASVGWDEATKTVTMSVE